MSPSARISALGYMRHNCNGITYGLVRQADCVVPDWWALKWTGHCDRKITATMFYDEHLKDIENHTGDVGANRQAGWLLYTETQIQTGIRRHSYLPDLSGTAD